MALRKNIDTAARYFRESLSYYDRKGIREEAVAKLKKLSDAGHPSGQFFYANYYMIGSKEQQIEYYLKAGAQGYAPAYLEMGRTQPPAESEKWFGKAAALKDLKVMDSIISYYSIRYDYFHAYKWHQVLLDMFPKEKLLSHRIAENKKFRDVLTPATTDMVNKLAIAWLQQNK
jgi:TPR repeat protein